MIKNRQIIIMIKFIYSEKATNVCEISTVYLTGTTQDKSTVEISQNFVAFSEYMNFIMINFYFYIAVLFLSMNKAILIPFAAKEHKSNKNNS